MNQKRGEAIGAYAVFFLPGQAEPKYEVMPLEDLEKVKGSSPAAASGPWVTWPDEMRKKTAIRRGFKTIPTSPKVQDTIEADTKMEMGVGVEHVLDLTLVQGANGSPLPETQSTAIASDLAVRIGGEGVALPPPPPPPGAPEQHTLAAPLGQTTAPLSDDNCPWPDAAPLGPEAAPEIPDFPKLQEDLWREVIKKGCGSDTKKWTGVGGKNEITPENYPNVKAYVDQWSPPSTKGRKE